MVDNLCELSVQAQAYIRLQSLEQDLRHFILGRMVKHYGPTWEHRHVPKAIHFRWKRRMSDRSKIPYAWIHPITNICELADFSDCKEVIINRENWGNIFRAVFGTPENITTKLDELYALRNEVMHMRPLTQTAVDSLDGLCGDVLGMIGGESSESRVQRAENV